MFVQSQSWREATDCGPETGLRPAPCAEAEAPTLPVGEQIYSTNKALLFLSKSSACGSPRFQHSQLVSGMWKCSAMGLANPCRVDLVYCEISANPSATCDSCAVLPVKRPESQRESCSDPCLRCRAQISNARRLDGNQ